MSKEFDSAYRVANKAKSDNETISTWISYLSDKESGLSISRGSHYASDVYPFKDFLSQQQIASLITFLQSAIQENEEKSKRVFDYQDISESPADWVARHATK